MASAGVVHVADAVAVAVDAVVAPRVEVRRDRELHRPGAAAVRGSRPRARRAGWSARGPTRPCRSPPAPTRGRRTARPPRGRSAGARPGCRPRRPRPRRRAARRRRRSPPARREPAGTPATLDVQVEPETDERRARAPALQRHHGLLQQDRPADVGQRDDGVDGDGDGLAVERRRRPCPAAARAARGAMRSRPPSALTTAEPQVVALHRGVADLDDRAVPRVGPAGGRRRGLPCVCPSGPTTRASEGRRGTRRQARRRRPPRARGGARRADASVRTLHQGAWPRP